MFQALSNLNKMQEQLTDAHLPSSSPQLAKLHADIARTIEEITLRPLQQGYSILESVGRTSQGTEVYLFLDSLK